MRSSFPGFYGVSEESIGNVFKSADTIFVFDANILLTLYRCEEDTRNRFIEIWEKIKDNCWFPHQVCLEYQRNRLKVVSDSRAALNKIPDKINSSIADLRKVIFGTEFNSTIARYTNLRSELDELVFKLEKSADEFSKKNIQPRRANIDFINSHDVIRDKIDELTDGRIGPAPADQSAIDNLNKLGKIRYQYKIGPGYDDEKEKEDKFYAYNGINYDAQYGDFYVWSQILSHVESNPQRPVVYVTNDAKSDFFYKIERKVRGPNESLITEMKKKGASEFLLQNIDTFLHHANTHLHANIDNSAINELTNASKNHLRSKSKWSLQKKLKDLDNNPESMNYILSGDFSEDELQDIYYVLQYRINKHNKEYNVLERLTAKNTDGIDLDEINRNKERLSNLLNMYHFLHKEIAKRITTSQEESAISELLKEMENKSSEE